MEGAIGTREINLYYPLESLERGGDKLNSNWPFAKTIEFIKICQKRYPECEIIIETDKPQKLIDIHHKPLNPLERKIDRWPEPNFVIISNYEAEKWKNGREIIHPKEYRMIITVDTKTIIQGNPPIQKIEFTTLLTREKTKSSIKKQLGKIPSNWQFNPRGQKLKLVV